jgi:hypothetical protein
VADQAFDAKRMEELFRQARAKLETIATVRPQVQHRIAAMVIEPTIRAPLWWGGAVAAALILGIGLWLISGSPEFDFWSRSPIYHPIEIGQIPAEQLEKMAKSELKRAIDDLSASKNYSWTMTYLSRQESVPAQPGVAQPANRAPNVRWECDGQTENGGLTSMTVTADNSPPTELVSMGRLAVILTSDGWKFPVEIPKASLTDSQLQAIRIAQNLKTPVVNASDLLAQVQNLRDSELHLSGEIGPTRINFWFNDRMSLSGIDERMGPDATGQTLTSETQITKVGTTVLNISEAAKAKLRTAVVNPSALPFN